MSYSKIEIHYWGDQQESDAKKPKTKTISLNKKVQDYGDFFGYYLLSVGSYQDHLIIRNVSGEVLMDKDINGDSYEWISVIVSYEWKE